MVRDHLLDWTFFGGWRWGHGWVTDERGGHLMGIFHDPHGQKVRAAVIARLMEI